MLVCCYARREPINFILLACFTLCEAWMIAGITAFYYTREVILAGAITALVTSALTAYAIQTKTRIEVFSALIWVFYFALIPLWIIGLFL